MKDNGIEKIIGEYEYWLAKYKFLQEKFPRCKVHRTYSPVTFSSNLVNSQYTNFNIETGFNTLFIEAYLEVEFEYNGNKENIKIFTAPRRNKLAHITYPSDPTNPKQVNWMGKKIIKFTNFKTNMNNRNINDSCWNQCRAAMMKFIKDNPKCDLDDKYLDPSLKKLLVFN
jgi:hypothetical protein